MGGEGADEEELNTAEVYDPQTDDWQPAATMSTARTRLGLAAVGGKIYAMGGEAGSEMLESIEAYDPQLGTWALVASMIGGREHHASVVLDGKIYAVGGYGKIYAVGGWYAGSSTARGVSSAQRRSTTLLRTAGRR